MAVLLPKIQESNLTEVLDTLMTSFLSGKKEHEGREMANIGLKTVIETITPHSTSAITVVRHFTPLLKKAMETKV